MAWAFGEFQLDPERFQLSCGGRPVQLEPQVLTLLIHLIQNRDRMVTKDEIVAAVWQGRAVSDASISSRIRSARQAVGDDGVRQVVIRTVHGRGFQFTPEVTAFPPAHGASATAPGEPREVPVRRPSIAVLPFQPLAMSPDVGILRSEEHTSELQSLMRISYAVFCLKQKKPTS